METTSEEFKELVRKHRRWLDRLRIREQPWLIFGSAPEPTVPQNIERTHLRVDINNSGRTARCLGLGRAALTIRARKKPWEEHPKLDTRALLWIHERHPLTLRLKVLARPHLYVGSISRMTSEEREILVANVAGTQLDGIGKLNKVTNGVAAICYGIALDVPQIVVSGISLSKEGHSYDSRQRTRRQVDEDAFILQSVRDHPSLFTTEAELASEIGLRLWPAA